MWIADDSHEISKLFLTNWNVVCYKFCLVLKELTIEWRPRGSSGRRRSRPACAYTQIDQGPQSLRTDFLDQTWQIATAKTMQTQIMLGDNSPNMTSVQKENVHCCRTRSANGPSSTEKCVFEHVQKTLIPTHFARAQSHSLAFALHWYILVSNDSVSGHRRTWSDCAFSQSDLGLRCSNMLWRHIFAWCAKVIGKHHKYRALIAYSDK